MPLVRQEIKVLFSTANSVSIVAGGNNSSDLVTLPDDTFEGSITLKADHAGTPVAGDILNVYVRLSSGDPDGAAAADEFASSDTKHARFIGQLDLFTTDPAIATFDYSVFPVAGHVYAVNEGASSVTFSAVIEAARST